MEVKTDLTAQPAFVRALPSAVKGTGRKYTRFIPPIIA